MSFPLSDLARRVAQMIRLGTVESVDMADATKPRCVISDGSWKTAAIPWVSTRAGNDAEFWAPEVGEQALVLSPHGDAAQAVALIGLFQTAMPAPGTNPDQRVTKYKDGAIESYDRAVHAYKLQIPAGGSITLQVGNTMLVLTESGAAVTSGDVSADGVSLKNHLTTGVKGGSDLSGPPQA